MKKQTKQNKTRWLSNYAIPFMLYEYYKVQKNYMIIQGLSNQSSMFTASQKELHLIFSWITVIPGTQFAKFSDLLLFTDQMKCHITYHDPYNSQLNKISTSQTDLSIPSKIYILFFFIQIRFPWEVIRMIYWPSFGVIQPLHCEMG